jgi:anthranilate synthase component 1
MSITIKEIAKELGVSAAAVSKALNNRPGIGLPLKLRIEKKARELGYAPYMKARQTGMYERSLRYLAVIYARAGEHLVSEIEGSLDKRYDIYDCLRACFPAGTVSGSPKIRAMEIIDELEDLRRGPYAGCVGYFSFSHNMDTCITIRTIIIKDNTGYIQAGAGIVADSVPEKEYFESINKARALIEAIIK